MYSPRLLMKSRWERLSLSHDDFLENLMNILRAVPTRGALTAGFMVVEPRHPIGQIDHADRVVHDDQGCGTKKGSRGFDGGVVEGHVELDGIKHAACRSGRKNSLEFPAFRNPATQIFNQVAKGGSQWNLVDSRAPNVAGKAKELCPG
jgi:hypothetical protein